MTKEENYYNSKESAEQYIAMTEGMSGENLIDKMTPFLEKGDKVLEIGSGPGNDWRILNNNFEVVGSDYSPVFVEYLKRTFPNGQFVEIDASKIDVEGKFNAIYSNKVLHHLSDDDLKTSIVRQSELLESEGIVCHSFWKGEGTEIFKGLFVNNHLEKDLEAFFESRFEILVLESYTEFEEGDSILLIAKIK